MEGLGGYGSSSNSEDERVGSGVSSNSTEPNPQPPATAKPNLKPDSKAGQPTNETVKSETVMLGGIKVTKSSSDAFTKPDLGTSSEESSDDESNGEDVSGSQKKSVPLPSVEGLFESVGTPKFLVENEDEVIQERAAAISASMVAGGQPGASTGEICLVVGGV